MRGVDVLLGIPAANVGGVAHAADGMIPATGANGRAGQVCSGVKGRVSVRRRRHLPARSHKHPCPIPAVARVAMGPSLVAAGGIDAR